LGFTALAAVLLALSRNWATRIPQEALIGVIYVVAAAAAILLIDRAPQGAEHLKQILTGNILTTSLNDIAVIVPLYLAVGMLHWLLRSRLTSAGSFVWELVFYATFGVVVTSSVALAGVLLVFSFLIIPAAIGVMYASSLPRQLAIGWTAGAATSALGIAASFAFDLPTGAAMVCAFGASLAVAGLLYPFFHGQRARATHAARRSARWAAAAILALSGIQLIAAPRNDQPMLDLAEYALPPLRMLYFTRAEAATFVDAREQAERYRLEAEKLNDVERRARTEGEAFDDFYIRRISSFLKSYGEMRNGEQFVMKEIQARARERIRWPLGGAMLIAALALTPGLLPRLRRAVPRRA
jgi:zinc/manganese transport system permease protein